MALIGVETQAADRVVRCPHCEAPCYYRPELDGLACFCGWLAFEPDPEPVWLDDEAEAA